MNYFEIFNKVLLELNCRPVSDFKTIYKSEHKKILNTINVVNNTVLSSYEWEFLLKRGFLDVPAGEIGTDIPFLGQIKSIYSKGERYTYSANCEDIIAGKKGGQIYSIINNGIVFPKCDKDRLFNIFYYSNNFALDKDGNFKPEMTSADDISVMPMPYAEIILVYGTCLKTKGNPSHPKFGFWNTMYIQALANLRQKSSHSVECEPSLKID